MGREHYVRNRLEEPSNYNKFRFSPFALQSLLASDLIVRKTASVSQDLLAWSWNSESKSCLKNPAKNYKSSEVGKWNGREAWI